MANALFDFGRDEFLQGDLDWIVDNHRVALVDDTDVTHNLATNQDWADLVAGLIHANAESGNMTGEASPDTDGTADADDETWSAVPAASDAADYVICFLETGTDATSTLIFSLDSTTTGLPVIPNDGDITVVWQATTPYIFKL